MDKWDVRNAVEKGVRDATAPDLPKLPWQESAMYIVSVFGFIALLITSLKLESWVLFIVGVLILWIGPAVSLYIPALVVPTFTLWMFYGWGAESARERGENWGTTEMIWLLMKDIGFQYLIITGVLIIIAWSYHRAFR